MEKLSAVLFKYFWGTPLLNTVTDLVLNKYITVFKTNIYSGIE